MRFNSKDAIEAQDRYCIEKKVPRFAPENGICWTCSRNIYVPAFSGVGTDDVNVMGISVDQAKSSLVTGCPYCLASFCE